MHTDLVVTISGPDRTGLVDQFASRIRAHGGNWEESRLMRLAGWFCGMLLVRVPVEQAEALETALRAVSADTVVTIGHGESDVRELNVVHLSVTCADRNGIVHDMSRTLVAQGANIEELHSDVIRAPMSGEPLFRATIRVSVPVEVGTYGILDALEALQPDLLVEVL
ncbi:MAG: glycine cleavage system protein R [Alphaproteobacteria bacterium]|nr:glycine cleavage system protein R [Alphaproteobacteria bacterium]